MGRIYHVENEMVFYDPGPEMAKVFAQLDPSYRVQSIQPGAGFTPGFQQLRDQWMQLEDPLIEMDIKELRELLDAPPQGPLDVRKGDIVSKFDILQALTLDCLAECRLCGWECGMNRYKEISPICGLGNEVFVKAPHITIAEETCLNPAILTPFCGCSMKCRHCIEHESQNVAGLPAVDPESTWNRVSNLLNQEIPTNCLEFLNPTESLHGVVQVLANAPRQFILPVVFNCHLYGSKSFYDLAVRIADIWLVDLTFGNDRCAKSISGVTDYIKYAKLGLDAVTGRGAKVIVRMLVLPGHGSCCHGPVVELLSEYREELWVSILDQYVPVHEACRDPKLGRRPDREEITRLENLVDRYGLRNIGKGCDDFWRV